MWASPLVRGLLAAPGEDQLHRRIIPARAGFTAAPTSPTASGPDHPRSRGGYWCLRRPGGPPTGSSPLARGLRVLRPGELGGARIIPARAGFTSMVLASSWRVADHPRSRGVYLTASSVISPSSGSSPLARGLRPRPGGGPIAMRIIPARAGFTTPLRPATAAGTDHPRSRGVYADRVAYLMVDMGSSPLARGLRRPRRLPHGGYGIIPARAGFTPPYREDTFLIVGSSPLARGLRADTTKVTDDHRIIPARAGFTGQIWSMSCARSGSSPLARGLHSPGRSWCAPIRIIPARAGFTAGSCGPLPRVLDHPRSRGVYGRMVEEPRPGLGSSPLARGLPTKGRTRRSPCGIIPARAGFTTVCKPKCHNVSDHPRSRGVYPGRVARTASGVGSSPLARGLQMTAATSVTDTGIIPARAGFTRNLMEEATGCRDHPRSRGVYAAPPSIMESTKGSSPLARGLPDQAVGRAIGDGIIPARAGFTRRPRAPCPRGPDHPRSRGVYADP